MTYNITFYYSFFYLRFHAESTELSGISQCIPIFRIGSYESKTKTKNNIHFYRECSIISHITFSSIRFIDLYNNLYYSKII